MLKQEVNINSFQKNLPELIDLVLKGDELIITKSNIPIAKVSPIENTSVTLKPSFFTARVMESKRARKTEAPENWFG
ncbi:MAG: type II toxin-antitoxin system Phd/YefM family antitoxin [Melioribacteraceae bacterium]|jgi:antitoxin (DNA-binding transcriptional repressor) of toxin-antitoxin stability system|nr:type II toxin-antitoxin system Phd/YefM family antitoxin [Melioribacteraceae bacterium]